MKYKNILKKITFVFVGLLLFLTFFSRTINDLYLPQVAIDFARQGVIHPEARSQGIVHAADTEYIFAPVTGRIIQIVEQGEIINAQTVLFTIAGDLKTLSDMLEREEHNRRIIVLNIERVQNEMNYEQMQLMQALDAPLILPTAPTLNLFEYDIQLENNENALALQLEINEAAMKKAHEELVISQTLYADGIIPQQDLIDAENEISRLMQEREHFIALHNQEQEQITLRIEQAILNHEAAMTAHEEIVESARQNNLVQTESHRNRISQLQFTLQTHHIELERTEAQIYDLAEQIADGGIIEVKLDEHGTRTVTEIIPNIGASISQGEAVMVTSFNNNRFFVDASFSQSHDFIDINQSATILFGTERLTGTTARVMHRDGRKHAVIEVQSDKLRGGETVSVIVSGGNTSHENVIPLSALRQDRDGYFVFYVESEQGRFGKNNYYIRTQRIQPVRYDVLNVAINPVRGAEIPKEPIILIADMPLFNGERVRIVNDLTATR